MRGEILMRARNSDDLQRLALSRGAEAEISGRSFNSGGDRVQTRTAEAARAPSGLTREDVIRIAAQMVSESEARTAKSLLEQTQAMTLAIANALKDSAPVPGRVVEKQNISITYDDDDRINGMTVTPIYKD
jgi:hypothetical protein